MLPSQSFASQMPALPKGEPRSRCEFVCSYAQSKLVSPSGRDVAQRQRGLESAGMAFQICPDTNLSACCPLSHLLRKCQLSQGESREGGANFFPLTHKPNLSLPLGEMSRSDREGWNQLAWLFKFALTRAFLSCAQNKNRASFDTLSLGGRWWIRFSAEKPRRLQHASSMLPRAGFRIHCSHSKF